MRIVWLLPLLILACTSTRLPVTDGRITTQEAFDTTVVGNLFTTQDLSVAFQNNGTFSGQEDGADFSGSWVFQDAELCVTRTRPEPRPTDCQIWTVLGNAFTVSRNSGAGPNTTYVYRYPLPPSYQQRGGPQ